MDSAQRTGASEGSGSANVDANTVEVVVNPISRIAPLQPRRYTTTTAITAEALRPPNRRSLSFGAAPIVPEPTTLSPAATSHGSGGHSPFRSATGRAMVLPQSSPSAKACYELPSFIKTPNLSRLSSAERTMLSKRGSLQLPEVKVRNELLRSFSFFVFPSLPIFDIHDFLHATQSDHPERPISLLLWHAVAFSASAVADATILAEAGFSSRKVARQYFYRCAEAYYNAGIEADRLVIAQAALLLTYWYEEANQPRDLWYWLNIGVTYALSIGVNFEYEDSDLDKSTCHLFKRLWWSFYIRDTIISLGLRTPPRIRTEDFCMSPLLIEDYDINETPQGLVDLFPHWEPEFYPRRVFEMHIMLGRLCPIVRNILSTRYSITIPRPGKTTEVMVKLTPKKQVAEKDVAGLDDALLAWFQQVPTYLLNASEHPQYFGQMALTSLIVHGAIVKAVWYMATFVLHLPDLTGSLPSSMEDSLLKGRAIQRTSMTLSSVVSLLEAVEAAQGISRLPITGLSLILPSMVAQVSLIGPDDHEGRNLGYKRLLFFMNIMEQMRSTYGLADMVTEFAAGILRRFDGSPRSSRSEKAVSASSETRMLSQRPLAEDTEMGQPSDTLTQMTLTGFENEFLQDLLTTEIEQAEHDMPDLQHGAPPSTRIADSNSSKDTNHNAPMAYELPDLDTMAFLDSPPTNHFDGAVIAPDTGTWMDLLNFSPFPA